MPLRRTLRVESRWSRSGGTWKTTWPPSTTCRRTCESRTWGDMTRSTVNLRKDEARRQKDEAKSSAFDALATRRDFPILQTPGLVYLDNGATSQKPRQVIEAVEHFYQSQNSNIHRGVYRLSQEATSAYEQARK